MWPLIHTKVYSLSSANASFHVSCQILQTYYILFRHLVNCIQDHYLIQLQIILIEVWKIQRVTWSIQYRPTPLKIILILGRTWKGFGNLLVPKATLKTWSFNVYFANLWCTNFQQASSPTTIWRSMSLGDMAPCLNSIRNALTTDCLVESDLLMRRFRTKLKIKKSGGKALLKMRWRMYLTMKVLKKRMKKK